MKKIALLASVMMISSVGLCDIIVTKKNRGLFGYKHVAETVAEGRHTLTCTDPGLTGCRSELSSFDVDGTLVLTSSEFKIIDKTVDESINENNTKGKFVFDNRCLITYSYDVNSDQVNYTIYSMEEAKEKGLI